MLELGEENQWDTFIAVFVSILDHQAQPENKPLGQSLPSLGVDEVPGTSAIRKRLHDRKYIFIIK